MVIMNVHSKGTTSPADFATLVAGIRESLHVCFNMPSHIIFCNSPVLSLRSVSTDVAYVFDVSIFRLYHH